MAERIDPALLQRQVRELPPLPQAVLEVLQVLRNDGLSADRCIHLIEQDPALAARTLRLANSAFYGVPGRVSRIADAVTLLGLRTVSAVLAAAALTQAVSPDSCPEFHFARYWRQAMATALCARLLAPRIGLDPEQAFLAGLMHDFGQLVLAAHHPGACAEALQLARTEEMPLHEAEQAVMGTDHAQVGALLARHWHFPEGIVAAVACHHAPLDGIDQDPAGLPCLMHLCDAVAHGLDLAGDPDEVIPDIDPRVWQAIDLDGQTALPLFAQIEASVHEMCAALQL